MSFDLILPAIWKILGCVVGIYIIAGFLVSCRRLLPLLAMGTAIGTCYAISYIRDTGNEDLFWVPVALSILMFLFYNGPGFMNPKIHENLYSLVSVERKWHSLFADEDDYELHFSPVETGGFIENTVFSGILFCIFYSMTLFNLDNWLVYAFAIFVAGMSVLDLVMSWGLCIGRGFYGLVRIFMIVISIVVGLIGPFNFQSKSKDWRFEGLYEACASFATLDYSESYNMEYIHYDSNYTIKPNRTKAQKRYVYDSTLNVGADYYYSADDEIIYKDIYTPNANYGEDVVRFSNKRTNGENSFHYVYKANTPSGPFMYSNIDTTTSVFMDLYVFTEDKFQHTYLYDFDAGTSDKYGRLCFEYVSRDWEDKDKNTKGYCVQWTFAVDEDKMPVALKEISIYDYFGNTFGHYEKWTYTILTDTGLQELFDENNNLKNYTYNENEIGGRDIGDITTSLKDYDCIISENGNDVTNYYLYDSDTDVVAVYNNRPDDAKNVSFTNISDYPPDYYVSNTDYSKYDGDCILVDSADENTFQPYTFDNTSVSNVIANMMEVPFILSNADYIQYYHVWGETYTLTITTESFDEDLNVSVNVYVRFNLDVQGCYIYDLLISCEYEGIEYIIEPLKNYTFPSLEALEL